MLQKDILGVGPVLDSTDQQQLPPEIAIQILGRLDIPDVLGCRLVSRRWWKLCNEQGAYNPIRN